MHSNGHADRDLIFRDLVLRNQNRFRGLARSFEMSETDDLLQEILFQVWRALSHFRGDSSIDTWCYRIALNTAISWRRRKSVHKPIQFSADAEAINVAGKVDAANEAELIHRFGTTLADVDRAIFLMFLDDFEYAAMSEILGISEGAIRVRVHRIKQRFSDWEPLDT